MFLAFSFINSRLSGVNILAISSSLGAGGGEFLPKLKNRKNSEEFVGLHLNGREKLKKLKREKRKRVKKGKKAWVRVIKGGSYLKSVFLFMKIYHGN